jgi:toxin FitB
MSRWLLDTCVLSELVKKKPEPRVIEWLRGHARESAICVVSVGEIQYGIERLEIGRNRNRLQAWLDEMRVNYKARTLVTNDAVWIAWGRLKFEAEHIGRSREDLDLLIAAVAKVHQLALVTRNTKHFLDTGVGLINPWDIA